MLTSKYKKVFYNFRFKHHFTRYAVIFNPFYYQQLNSPKIKLQPKSGPCFLDVSQRALSKSRKNRATEQYMFTHWQLSHPRIACRKGKGL